MFTRRTARSRSTSWPRPLRPILGPFELQTIRQALGRTDALFDQLDRDKDGQLTRSELSVITGSLRPLDLDDDQMISAYELEPFNNTAMASVFVDGHVGRADRALASPTVVELLEGESTLRPARLLLKRYDKPKDDIPGSQDNKLSPKSSGSTRMLSPRLTGTGMARSSSMSCVSSSARPPFDLALDVTFPPDSAGRAKASPAADPARRERRVKVRQIDDGDIEVVVGQVRVDVQVYDAAHAAEEVRRILTQQFKALDSNKDGYLEGKEQAAFNAPQSPLSGLSMLIDRDGDGKIYLKELLDFADRQSDAARGRLVTTAADQGRAIFGIVDLDRDRRLGARELLRTLERVTSWDGDSDGRVSADEIPVSLPGQHHPRRPDRPDRRRNGRSRRTANGCNPRSRPGGWSSLVSKDGPESRRRCFARASSWALAKCSTDSTAIPTA